MGKNLKIANEKTTEKSEIRELFVLYPVSMPFEMCGLYRGKMTGKIW